MEEKLEMDTRDITEEEKAAANKRITDAMNRSHTEHASQCDGSCFTKAHTVVDAARSVIVELMREAAHLRGWREECDGMMSTIEKISWERDTLRAEVNMLRGVGCDELDGTDVRGPCGVCLKCARRERDDLAKRLRNAETMRNAFVATSVAFATQEVDAIGHGAELMRGTIAALVRALPIDPATMALIDHAITNAEIPRENR